MGADQMPDYHWRCACHGGHFLTLTWDASDPTAYAEIEGYLSVEGDNHTPWRDRIAEAWRLLRHGCATTRVGVILDEAKALEVADALTDYLSYFRAVRVPVEDDTDGG